MSNFFLSGGKEGRKQVGKGKVLSGLLLTFFLRNEIDNNSCTLCSSKDVKIPPLILKTNPLLSTSKYVSLPASGPPPFPSFLFYHLLTLGSGKGGRKERHLRKRKEEKKKKTKRKKRRCRKLKKNSIFFILGQIQIRCMEESR